MKFHIWPWTVIGELKRERDALREDLDFAKSTHGLLRERIKELQASHDLAQTKANAATNESNESRNNLNKMATIMWMRGLDKVPLLFLLFCLPCFGQGIVRNNVSTNALGFGVNGSVLTSEGNIPVWSTVSTNPSAGFSNRLALTITSRNTADAANQRLQIVFSTNPAAPLYINQSIINANGWDIKIFDSDGVTPFTNVWASVYSSNTVVAYTLPFIAHDIPRTNYLDYGNASIVGPVTTGWTNILTVRPLLTNSTVLRYLFNEGSGTQVIDSSAAQTNGTMVVSNGPVWLTSGGPGPSGSNVVGFNSTFLRLTNGTFAYSTNSSAWNQFVVNAFSVSCWIRFTNAISDHDWVWMKSMNPGASRFVSLYTKSGAFTIQYPAPSGQVEYIGATSISLNTWYHVVTTFGPQGAKIYVNGKLDSISSVADCYSPVEDSLAQQRAFVINGDGRGTGPVANSPAVCMDFGPMTVDLREWQLDEILQDFKFLGFPVFTLEKDKWYHNELIPSYKAVVAQNVAEMTRIFSSYDGQWKIFSLTNGAAQHIVGLTSSDRDGQYTAFSVTTSGTVQKHGWFLDDGHGTIYCYFINPSTYDVGYATSVNGGANFTVSGSTISTASQMVNASTPGTGGEGNVSMTKLDGGPLNGQFCLLVEIKNAANTTFQLRSYLGTNYFGTFNVLNFGNALSSMNQNSSGYTLFGDPSQVIWANSRYQCYILSGIGVAPTYIIKVSSFDLVNWFIDGSAIELNDIAYAFDQNGDQRMFSESGGSCSMMYSMVNNNLGNASFPQYPSGFGWVSYNGSKEQLWTIGTFGVNGERLFGDISLASGTLQAPSAFVTPVGFLVHSNTLSSLPTLVKGDNFYWSSNGIAYVICSSPAGVLTTNKLAP